MTAARTFGRRGIAQPKVPHHPAHPRGRPSRSEQSDSLDDSGRKLMLQFVGYAGAGALLVLGLLTVGTLGRGTAIDKSDSVAKPKLVVSEPCGATMLEYLKLRRGMTYPEVKRSVGCGGEILSQVDLGGTTSVMLKWDACNSFIGSMTTTFQNGQLVAWAQFDLR